MPPEHRTEHFASSPVIDRVDIIRRLKATGREPEMASASRTVEARDYVDLAYFEEERRKLFREYPAFVCLSSQLANPGDYRSAEIGDVPLFFVRGKDGTVRGFRNTCRHRGAPLAMDKCGSGMKKIVCPYHGWSYSDAGELHAVPLKKAFPGIDMAERGLIPVRTWEEAGFVFVLVDDNGSVAQPTTHLGTITRELDALGFTDMQVSREDTVITPTNWKLALEAFGESYHLPALHRSLASVMYGSSLTFDDHAPHSRFTSALFDIHEILDNEESTWSDAVAGKHFVMLYLIFPNIVMTIMDGSASITVITPGRNPGEAITTQYQAVSPSLDDKTRIEHEGFYTMALNDLTIPEDYLMATGIYNSLKSGNIDHIIMGRCEAPLVSYHNHRERMMTGNKAR